MKSAPQPVRILIVDDDAVTRSLLRNHFDHSGNEVWCVGSALEAMPIIASQSLHIVVADWLMPAMSGLELVRWMRAQHLPRTPHFVMLTANTGRESLIEAFDVGVDDFLTKPFHETELMARLQAWSRLVHLQEESARLAAQLIEANRALSELASCDELTGLANRRAANEHLAYHLDLARRYDSPLSCAILDVDRFKDFNDRYGHSTGDAVLKHLAAVMLSTARVVDVCCRLGGDEFLVIFPQTEMSEVKAWTRRFQVALDTHPLVHQGRSLDVRASIGIASGRAFNSPEQIIDAADKMLYQAKRLLVSAPLAQESWR